MIDVLIQQLLDEAEARRDAAQRRMYEIHDRNIPQELTPWLRRTGWVRRFDKKDMKALYDLLEQPKPNSIRSALEPPNRGRTTLKKSAMIEIPSAPTKSQPLEGGSTLWRGGFVGRTNSIWSALEAPKRGLSTVFSVSRYIDQ